MRNSEYFTNIIGYENVKKELSIVIDMIRNSEKYQKLGANLIRGILLHGEPGTGKTTLANDFIEASGLSCYRLRKNESDGDFIKEINKVFRQASYAAVTNEKSVIVFLDDMDKFATGSSKWKNDEEYVAIQSCIDLNKENRIIVVATVNDMDCLPDSLVREGRFDKVLYIGSPDEKDAEKIVEYYLKKKKQIGQVDCREIAGIMAGRSCAQLETVINEAAISAAYQNKELIDMDDIIKASLRVIYRAPRCQSENDDGMMYLAYHEAGHAVVSEILNPESVNLVSIEKYNNSYGGITSYLRESPYYKTFNMIENKVMTALAGKAANEVVFGICDIGCSDDLSTAFDLISKCVDDLCLCDFSSYQGITRYGQESMKYMETTVSMLMQQYYNKTKKIIIENREFLDYLARELMEKKTLTWNGIQKVKNNVNCLREKEILY